MENLLQAIKNKDIVKARRIFNEAMEEKKKNLVESEKIKVARAVRIEEESEKPKDDNSDDEDDEAGDDKEKSKSKKDDDKGK